jgi:hypothetical protein
VLATVLWLVFSLAYILQYERSIAVTYLPGGDRFVNCVSRKMFRASSMNYQCESCSASDLTSRLGPASAPPALLGGPTDSIIGNLCPHVRNPVPFNGELFGVLETPIIDIEMYRVLRMLI